MMLYFDPPPEGSPLVEGVLRDERGEPIEGVMIQEVLYDRQHKVTSIRFTLLAGSWPDVEPEVESDAIEGLTALARSLSVP